MIPYIVSKGVKAWATTTEGHGLSSPQSENNNTDGGMSASVSFWE